ncbi:hypothetical protein ACFL00_05340 [Pseudomonadota bacterium]
MKKVLYISLVLLAVLAWRDWSHREIVYAPGVLVPERPRQTDIDAPLLIRVEDYRLTPRAKFDLRARVLSSENYRWGSEADLSPVDLALGWGPMSDQAVLNRISITQGSRWYFTRYELPAPISDRDIINNSSNMHVIPANLWVRNKLKEVRKGNIVEARGMLVDVDADSGFSWRTSVRRDDTGNGSCEIFYVESLYIEDS